MFSRVIERRQWHGISQQTGEHSELKVKTLGECIVSVKSENKKHKNSFR